MESLQSLESLAPHVYSASVKGARKPQRRPASGSSARNVAPAVKAREPFAVRLGIFALWVLLFVPPFLVSPAAKEAFRLPKLLASGWLALASLLFLCWRLREVEEIAPASLWRRPALRAVLPLLLVATATLATTAHPLHVRDALADLWIGAAALVGWSLALETRTQERLLRGLLIPAAGLALFGILQYHGYQPLPIFGLDAGSRLTITATAGNPGDLGAYLVLPCLIAQWGLASGIRGGRRVWTAIALALCVYALALTQTLAAIAALLAGSLILWMILLPRRKTLPALAGAVALAAVLVLAVTPLRERAFEKVGQAARGDLNAVLTGRLDGWNAATWMLREHPWTGVGHGAYRPEFIPAKTDLMARGVPFYPGQNQVVFANAHNEVLEAGADWGIPGLLALAWGLWVLLATLRRIPPRPGEPELEVAERRLAAALAWSGVIALAVLSLAHFPFRIALVAYPAVLFLSWALRQGDRPAPEVPVS